jgi:hypothetical protein
MTSEVPASATPRALLSGIGAIALVVRLAFVAVHPVTRDLGSDMGCYLRSARHLLDANVADPLAGFFAPGYPAIVAAALATTGLVSIGPLQALLGALTCVLAGLVTFRVTGNARSTALVGLLMALHPAHVISAGFLMTESVAGFAAVAVVGLVLGTGAGIVRQAALGVAAGTAVCVRPDLGLVVAAALALHVHARGLRSAIVPCAAIAFAVGLASWHTSIEIGRLALVSTHGGANLYLSFHDLAGVLVVREGQADVGVFPVTNLAHHTAVERTTTPLTDASWMRAGMRGLATRRAPLRALRNLVDGFGVGRVVYWPASRAAVPFLRVALRVLGVVSIAGALVGARSLFRPDGAVARVVAIAALTCVPVLAMFRGDPRVRLAYDPLLFALAAQGLTRTRFFRRCPTR